VLPRTPSVARSLKDDVAGKDDGAEGDTDTKIKNYAFVVLYFLY
jgi:hypothetical protein